MQPPPKPGLPLVLASTTFILACLVMMGGFLSIVVRDFQPGGLVIIGPICVVLAVVAWVNYAGAFRGDVTRAGTAAAVNSVFALGMIILGVAAGIANVDIGLEQRLLLAAGFLLGAVFGIGTAWLYRRRQEQLQEHQYLAPPQQFSLKELMLLTAAFALVAALATAGVRGAGKLLVTYPPSAEHVSPEATPFDLPPGASDVSYCRTGNGLVAYEFTTDEAGFRQWVASGIGSWESRSAGVSITPINTFTTIYRYTAITTQYNGPDYATVTQGLEYHWSKEDRGVNAVFDSATGRAYYYSHSR